MEQQEAQQNPYTKKEKGNLLPAIIASVITSIIISTIMFFVLSALFSNNSGLEKRLKTVETNQEKLLKYIKI